MTQCKKPVLIAALLICASLVGVAASQQPLSYDIDLTIDYDQGTFYGRGVVDYTNTTGQVLAELFFRLFANDPTLYGTASVHIDSVSVQTASMPFYLFVNDTVLMVPLETPLQPEARIAVDFVFSGQTSFWPASESPHFSQTGYGLLTKSASALTMTAFYPILAVYSSEGWALDPSTGFGDTLMAETADYNVILTVQSGSTPVTSGTRIDTREVENGLATYTFLAPRARDFALVLIDNEYQSKTIETGQTTLHAWCITQAELTAERTVGMAADALRVYEQLVGPSPFDEIDLIEVPLNRAGGVEFAGLILVSSQYAQNTWDLFYPVIISHEMAHQWFYAGVGNDVSEHPWLDESLATYLSYEFLRTYEGIDRAQSEMAKWDRAYTPFKTSDTHLAISSPKYAFPNSATYSTLVYSGGATFFDALRDEIGAHAFYQALQTYYSQFLHRIATPADLFQIVEESCSCSIDELLSEFRIMP